MPGVSWARTKSIAEFAMRNHRVGSKNQRQKQNKKNNKKNKMSTPKIKRTVFCPFPHALTFFFFCHKD